MFDEVAVLWVAICSQPLVEAPLVIIPQNWTSVIVQARPVQERGNTMSKRRTPTRELRAWATLKEQIAVKLTAEVSREHQLSIRKHGFGRYTIATGESRLAGEL